MTANFLSGYPNPDRLINFIPSAVSFAVREVNGHIHTPYSFSAFSDIDEALQMASAEEISVLGINDFYVTDGYRSFYHGCVSAGIFPLFNIEFIGLMKAEQRRGIRINDLNNAGRIYFCGKGLDYPFHLNTGNSRVLEKAKAETQNQLRAMVEKMNTLLRLAETPLSLNFDEIKKRYAHGLVRERHLAKALRILCEEHFGSSEARNGFLESLYGGKKSKAGTADHASLENEIRSNLLKSGGLAFVEEDDSSFLDIHKIKNIITDAGGIPCYPVLLDDPSGRFTEFESDPVILCSALSAMDVGCIELIPSRNDPEILEEFVNYFDAMGFVILFGTEHNTPEMIPLRVTARGSKPLGSRMKQINFKGASVIAAHQYLRAKGLEGFIAPDGKPKRDQIEEFELTGRKTIEYFLSKK